MSFLPPFFFVYVDGIKISHFFSGSPSLLIKAVFKFSVKNIDLLIDPFTFGGGVKKKCNFDSLPIVLLHLQSSTSDLHMRLQNEFVAIYNSHIRIIDLLWHCINL